MSMSLDVQVTHGMQEVVGSIPFASTQSDQGFAPEGSTVQPSRRCSGPIW